MKVFLTSAYPYTYIDPPLWLRSKSAASSSICTDDPALADIIIFVESHPRNDPYFRMVLHHPLFRKYRKKCVLYHDADLSITTLPTIFPSIESWQFNPKHKRSFHYIARVNENETIDKALPSYTDDRDYLYSFIGAKTHGIRNAIFNNKHPADAFLKDTTGIRAWELKPADKVLFQQDYFTIMDKSLFILAPRGVGPCTYRLFESMQLGRVPVIISDAWVKIPHLDWDKFSITVPESQISSIPEILLERKNEAVAMGKLARQYWEDYFSPAISLYQIAEAAKDLLQHRYSFMDSLKDHAQFLQRPSHLKNFFRAKKNQLKSAHRNLQSKRK